MKKKLQKVSFLRPAPRAQQGSVTITFPGTRNDVGSNSYSSWYQQLPGKKPKLLLYSQHLAFADPERASGSSSGITASLSISGLQPEDKANCYRMILTLSTRVQVREEVRPKPALSSQLPRCSKLLPAPCCGGCGHQGLENSRFQHHLLCPH